MKRRNFIQGIFAAVVLAVIPAGTPKPPVTVQMRELTFEEHARLALLQMRLDMEHVMLYGGLPPNRTTGVPQYMNVMEGTAI